MRLLYLTRERCPSLRPDLDALFGRVLPQYGVLSDLVGERDCQLEPQWGGGRVFARPTRTKLGRLLVKFLSLVDAYRLCRRGGYDAIQVRDRIFGGLVGLLIARLHGLAFYYWLSLPFPEAWLDLGSGQSPSSASLLQRLMWSLRGRISYWLLYRVVLPRSDHVFAQSDAMKAALVSYGVPHDCITPVPMGVDFDRDRPLPPGASDPFFDGKTLLVYLGALERLRHPEVMLDALSLVRERFADVVLLLVGDSARPSDRAWLDMEIHARRLASCVRITGWIPRHQAHEYLRAARIGLSPIPRTRVFEVSSPTKVAEYLANGLPVVANDQPDQAIVVSNTGCGVCVAMNGVDFARGIIELLEDPARLKDMANRGPNAIYALRSYDVLGQELAGVYRDLARRTVVSGN